MRKILILVTIFILCILITTLTSCSSVNKSEYLEISEYSKSYQNTNLAQYYKIMGENYIRTELIDIGIYQANIYTLNIKEKNEPLSEYFKKNKEYAILDLWIAIAPNQVQDYIDMSYSLSLSSKNKKYIQSSSYVFFTTPYGIVNPNTYNDIFENEINAYIETRAFIVEYDASDSLEKIISSVLDSISIQLNNQKKKFKLKKTESIFWKEAVNVDHIEDLEEVVGISIFSGEIKDDIIK